MLAKRRNNKRPDYLGRGLKFPISIDPRTGGFAVNEGSTDETSVGLEMTPDAYSLRKTEGTYVLDNHIAGGIANILLTKKLERDTLPEFGSEVYRILFEQISVYSMQEFEVWLQLAIARWEYRVSINPPEDVTWHHNDFDTDRGKLPITVSPRFINSQAVNNLVAPYVSPRQARLQEYQSSELDVSGHDTSSRYFGYERYRRNGLFENKTRTTKRYSKASDDVFYRVKHYDTWYLISHYLYGDVRYWWIIVDFYIQDASSNEESRDKLKNYEDPPAGEILRVPSKTRLFMDLT